MLRVHLGHPNSAQRRYFYSITRELKNRQTEEAAGLGKPSTVCDIFALPGREFLQEEG